MADDAVVTFTTTVTVGVDLAAGVDATLLAEAGRMFSRQIDQEIERIIFGDPTVPKPMGVLYAGDDWSAPVICQELGRHVGCRHDNWPRRPLWPIWGELPTRR